MPFPNSNLPSTSQPWARDVQKRVESLESNVKANEINNTARDVQLANSYKRLDKAVNDLIVADAAITVAVSQAQQAADDAATAATKAQQALDGLGSLDESTSTYKINAANLTVGQLSGDRIYGGTITGATLETAYSGRRVRISGTTATFYDESGEYSGTITVGGTGNSSVMTLNGPFTSRSISFSSSNTLINGGAGTSIDLNDAPAIVMSGGPVQVTNTNNISSTGVTTAPLLVSGTMGIDGNEITTANNLNMFLQGSNSSGAVIIGAGGGDLSVRNAINVGSAGTLTIGSDRRMYPVTSSITGTPVHQSGSGGALTRQASSRRYKVEIQDAEYGLDILKLRPRTWVDKASFEENGNSLEGLPRNPGFIAEEVYEAGLTDFVYMLDGQPESLHYGSMVSAVVSALKIQQATIEGLSARIEALENK